MYQHGPPDDLEREYYALLKQLDAGHYTDPQEIWDVIQKLMEAGDFHHRAWAERLGTYLPKAAGG